MVDILLHAFPIPLIRPSKKSLFPFISLMPFSFRSSLFLVLHIPQSSLVDFPVHYPWVLIQRVQVTVCHGLGVVVVVRVEGHEREVAKKTRAALLISSMRFVLSLLFLCSSAACEEAFNINNMGGPMETSTCFLVSWAPCRPKKLKCQNSK